MSSNTIRITGMATGLDVDELVSKMMKGENTHLDKLKQDRQLVQWRQDAYRDIIGDLNTFKGTYFDVLKSDTYMLSSKNYSSFDVKSSDSTNSVAFTAGAGAVAGNYKIDVAQLAGKAIFQGTSSFENLSIYNKMSSIIPGVVEFTINNQTFHYDFSTDTDKDKTISDILSDISSKANVNITYSELTGKFTLSSKDTGANQVITNTQDSTGDFLKTFFGQSIIPEFHGQDAEVQITEPGNSSSTLVTKSTNSFTIDGVNYVLNNQPASGIAFTVTPNAQNTYDKIKTFIDKYNEIIGNINSKISEKKQYDYLPLTDEQKKEMSENEIKDWEAKAKQGIISRDKTLENMLSNMRTAFYDKVEGAGVYLTDIGLSTSSDISERGKIVIDEGKLKKAIQNNPDKVANLFMKQSNTQYSPDSKSLVRYNEEGIFQRINDIFQDNFRTMRDSRGRKGILLEEAGIKGDFSEFHNTLTDELKDQDGKIADMIEKLAEKENQYYLNFSKLEKAIEQLNQQASWLSQQLGAR